MPSFFSDFDQNGLHAMKTPPFVSCQISVELVHQGHMETGKFHLGTTKIFLRTATQRTLDAAREEHVRANRMIMMWPLVERAVGWYSSRSSDKLVLGLMVVLDIVP